MRRTTITLPDDLASTVAREARRRGVGVSTVVRDALEQRFRGRRTLPFTALGRSGKATTARDFEEVLAAEWSDDRDR
jgi:metal-responsive CopG/Arc/MetJ family transcriptional regulator